MKTQELNILNLTNKNLSKYKKIFNNIFFETLNFLKINENIELSLVINTDEKQRDLNKNYRNKDYIPDVLTFSLEEKSKVNLLNTLGIRNLGDIFICYNKAIEQSKKYNHSLKRELSFLFVHGMLHILGYDHIKKEDEEIMFKLQKIILNNLNIKRKNNE